MSEENKEATAPVAPATSNKTVKYVVIAIVALAVLGYGAKYLMGMFAMGALNASLAKEGVHISGNPMSGGSYTLTDKDGRTVNVDPSADGGYNMTDEKGNSVTVGASAKLPDDFPSIVPIYSGAVVSANVTSNENGRRADMVTFTSKEDFASIDSFYKSSLAKNGWKTTQSMTMSANYTMYTAENGDTVLSVMIQGAENGSDSTIAVSVAKKQ